MQTEKISLFDLIKAYLEAKKDFDFWTAHTCPDKPQLKKAYTIAEYNNYTNLLDDYNAEMAVIMVSYKNAKKLFYELEQQVLETLPSSHVWFLTEGNEYAIAIQRSDWPMDPPKILVKENPVIDELPQLKLQHIPG